MTLAFLTEPAPAYGTPEQITPRLRRLIAPNPGPMTYHGTNTWLADTEDGTIVIDPGPDNAAHVAAILAAAPTPITAILLTHTHPDHLGATASLRAATNAPVLGWHAPWQSGFDIPSMIVAIIGAVIVLAIYHAVFRRRSTY